MQIRRHATTWSLARLGKPIPGQVLVMFALMLVCLVGMTGLAIDGGMAYLEKRRAQSAADLAALAGAVDLPGAPVSSVANATDYAAKNGYTDGTESASVSVVTPYKGNPAQLEVTVRRDVQMTFMRLLGFDQVNVGARAVAQARRPEAIAIFAINSGCDKGIVYSGNEMDIVGDVHTNSWLKWDGNDNSLDGKASAVCKFETGGTGNYFAEGPNLVSQREPPVSFTAADFPCDYTYPSRWDVSASSVTLPSGVHCAPDGISLSGDYMQGDVTLVSGGEIKISGNYWSLNSYRKDVLAYTTSSSSSAVNVSGNGGSWQGYLYAPNGHTIVSGNDGFSFNGSIISNTIDIQGNNWSINAYKGLRSHMMLVE